MTTLRQIKTVEQSIARREKSLALEKLRKHKADTRRKIELGGLVIKAGMDGFSKAVILGALDYTAALINGDSKHKEFFENTGSSIFLSSD